MNYTHCTTCNKEKITPSAQTKALCKSCSKKGIKKPKTSESMKGNTNGEGNKGNTRTFEQRQKISIGHGGNGNIDANIKNKRKFPGNAKWSKAVKARDGACIDCGSTEHLEAHHLVAKAKFPEVATELWNGITLCRKCHIAEHKIIGKK